MERLRQSFADQFEADGKDIFYRKNMKGPPVLVTRAEHAAFVTTYNRRLRYAMWPIPFVTILVIGLLAWFAPDTRGTTGQWSIGLGVCLAMAPSLIIIRWAWSAPARELKLRTSSGPARSRDEVRRMMFSKISYQQLGVAAVGAAFLVLKASAHHDVLHGWGRVWLVTAGGLIALTGLQAVRKWRHERA